MSIFDGADNRGLWANVAAAVAAVLLVNGLIFGLGWDAGGGGDAGQIVAVPGYVVGVIWTLLFAAMATARWLLLRRGTDDARRVAGLVSLLLLSCLLYPFYALALHSRVAGLAGNLLTIGFAAVAAFRARPASRPAAALVSLVVAWVVFATATTRWFA